MPLTKSRQKKKVVPQPATVEDASEPEGAPSRTATPIGPSGPAQKHVSFKQATLDSKEVGNSKGGFTLASNRAETPSKPHVHIAPNLHPDDKAFKVPVVFRVKHKGSYTKVAMPVGMTHGDQGSDMNLISEPLRKAMGFSTIFLNSKGWSGLTMNTADGNASPLIAYTTFMMGVKGIWRRVFAFIRPESRANNGELSLLLGLPWLDDVDAKIHIRNSTIEIGDRAMGEASVIIQGPMFVPSQEHRLILHPKATSLKVPTKKIPLEFPVMDLQSGESDTSTDDESGYTSSEDSSDDESSN